MSRDARDWAYAQPLKAPAKPVLVALAEHGARCWPSIHRLAEMTGYDKRTVRRAIRALERAGLLEVEQQPGKAAIYSLSTPNDPGQSVRGRAVTVSALTDTDPGQSVRGGRSECPGGAVRVSGGGGQSVRRTEKNRKRTVNEPPLPRARDNQDAPHDRAPAGGGGDVGTLAYPQGMSLSERQAAARILNDCNGHAQEILDELAALMRADRITVSPLSCLAGMARRAKQGTFTPEAGISISAARSRRQAETRKAPDPVAVLREHARLLGVDETSYVAQFASPEKPTRGSK